MNSQILNVFYDSAVDLCNIYDEISLLLFLTNAIFFLTNWTVDLSDQLSFVLLIIWTNDPWPLTSTRHAGISTFQSNDPWNYRPVGATILQNVGH